MDASLISGLAAVVSAYHFIRGGILIPTIDKVYMWTVGAIFLLTFIIIRTFYVG